MGDHHDGSAVGVQFLDLVDDLGGGLAVQGACGLIGEEDLRVVDHGAGDAGALELTAADLVDIVIGDLDDAEFSHDLFAAGDLFGSGFLCFLALDRGEKDVVHDGQVLHHEHLLEDESHVVQTDGSEVLLGKGGDLFSIELDRAGSGTIHTGDCIKESAFAGAGRAHDADHLAFFDVEADILQDVVLALLDDVCFAEILDFEYFFHFVIPPFFVRRGAARCLCFAPQRAGAFAVELFDVGGVAGVDGLARERDQEGDDQGGQDDDAGVDQEDLERLDRVVDFADAHHAEDRADAEVRHRDREGGGEDHGEDRDDHES